MDEDDWDDAELHARRINGPLIPGRRILRNTVAVFLIVFFIVTTVLSYRIGAVVSAVVAALYALVQFLATRYCVTCGQPVLRGPWSTRTIPCPACGSPCRFAWQSRA